jgi:4-hydroxybenzoate polyprenyltransferase/phosphoserine phosphatase
VSKHERISKRGATPAVSSVPLVVDLDGTLTTADVSLEAFVRFAKSRVSNFLLLILWLFRGRSVAKAMVARALPLDVATLPVRQGVVELIKRARDEGRPVILASASHQRNITRVAYHIGLFDLAWGTTARHNLKGKNKLARILAHTGGAAFDYVGDSKADEPLWKAARNGYTLGHVPKLSHVSDVSAAKPSKWRAVIKTLRPHQWAKNALIFVPVATAGLLFDFAAVGKAALATLFFSMVASAIYQINDMLDIDADRAHTKKQARPLAAGTLSIPFALGLSTILLLLPLVASALTLGPGFTAVLAIYIALTSAYSFRLKAVMTLDVIALACLYTIRIIAGAAAVSVVLSFWLLLFSIFFFLSLGYLKRYTELAAATEPGRLLKGRGYLDSDLEIVAMSGISAGMVSILVMALFINDIRESGIYPTPQLLWTLCIGLLYWINRVWMMARRGQVDGDPVAFALKDARSIAVGGIMALAFIGARFLNLGIFPLA